MGTVLFVPDVMRGLRRLKDWEGENAFPYISKGDLK